MILSQGGKPADILMEVTVPVIKQMKCRKQTRWFEQVKNIWFPIQQLQHGLKFFSPDTGRVRSQRIWCVPDMTRGCWTPVRVKYSHYFVDDWKRHFLLQNLLYKRLLLIIICVFRRQRGPHDLEERQWRALHPDRWGQVTEDGDTDILLCRHSVLGPGLCKEGISRSVH